MPPKKLQNILKIDLSGEPAKGSVPKVPTQLPEDEPFSLEEGFAQLDDLLDQLENPDITLDESFKLYREGIEKLRLCNDSISKVESALTILEEEGI